MAVVSFNISWDYLLSYSTSLEAEHMSRTRCSWSQTNKKARAIKKQKQKSSWIIFINSNCRFALLMHINNLFSFRLPHTKREFCSVPSCFYLQRGDAGKKRNLFSRPRTFNFHICTVNDLRAIRLLDSI